ncbi:single-stranded DNA-binding protein, partial [Salmonella enterica]|uniref:single-stranded DNA-binding protein n=1 Tax=Salmonella enterica TaxID=28901 RepID=UPI00225A6289
VTGNIAQPELRFTNNGKPVLELRIGATPRKQNPQTKEWEDWGAPLWYSATFWEAEAEHLAQTLQKGMKVTVTGTQVVEP